MGMRQRAVRYGDLKLVGSGSDQPELYDLAKDIGEARNLARKRTEEVKKLQALWQAWGKEMTAPQWGRAEGQAASARPKVFEQVEMHGDGRVTLDEARVLYGIRKKQILAAGQPTACRLQIRQRTRILRHPWRRRRRPQRRTSRSSSRRA